MAKKVSDYKIPFNLNGDQLHYASEHDGDTDRVKWMDNFEFHDAMKIEGMERGRSAAYFHIKSTTTNKQYTLFMKEMCELIQNSIIDHGEVEGTWTFVKRGQNYGVARLL